MNISFNPNYTANIVKSNVISNRHMSSNLAPLTQDTVSFSGRKKADLIKMEKEKLGDAIKNNDVEVILNNFGIETQQNKNGLYTISHYEQPKKYSYKELGINENKMFEKIERIDDYAIFCGSDVTKLGSLKSIGGNAYFGESKIKDLKGLETIEKRAFCMDSKLNEKSFENVDVKEGIIW